MPSLAFVYINQGLDILQYNLLVLKVLQLLGLFFTVLKLNYGLNVLAVLRLFDLLFKFLVEMCQLYLL